MKKEDLSEKFEQLTIDGVKRVGVVYDKFMLKHKNYEYDHPERPERVEAIHDYLVD